jgi:hypothetical protein
MLIFEGIPGGNCGGATPVPIPNTEVKPASAYGTAIFFVGEWVVAGVY